MLAQRVHARTDCQNERGIWQRKAKSCPDGSQARMPEWFQQFRRPVMNWDTIKGQWKQFKGKVKEKWGDLTDDDLDIIDGKRDQLVGKLQERYGYAKDEAEK